MVRVLPIAQEVDATNIEDVLIDQNQLAMKSLPGLEHPGPKPRPKDPQLNTQPLNPGPQTLSIDTTSKAIHQDSDLESTCGRSAHGL
jgi:hypothetical protein